MIEEKYNTFARRLGAGIIDGLVFLPPRLMEDVLVTESRSHLVVGIWIQFDMWSYVAYSVLLHGLTGQTVGKMVCKVKVLDVSERKLTLEQALARDSVPIALNILFSFCIFPDMDSYIALVRANDLSSFPAWLTFMSSISLVWFVLELITMLTNKKRRAIHDFIVRSVVCRIP